MNDTLLTHENPYRLGHSDKQRILLEGLNQLNLFHYKNCHAYQNILDKTAQNVVVEDLSSLPYLPVQLFKMVDLFSRAETDKFKTLTSSGTTGQQVSRIHLDKETALLQTRALNVIVRSFLGTERLPMIIVDTDILKNRKQFSARTAGTIGFSQFGRQHFYLLDENMDVREHALAEFLETHRGKPIFLFGFTYIIWEYLVKRFSGSGIDLSGSLLIHGGGWKRIENQAVDNDTFKKVLRDQFAIERVYNYYGMVEQVGSIFMECEQGYLHTPDFADVIVRDVETLGVAEDGQAGLLQVLSLLPKSYPGHSLLTEDLGAVYGTDVCRCGRKGKYFKVFGRVPKAEARGCSDTFTI